MKYVIRNKEIFGFESNKSKKVVNMMFYTKIQYESNANILHRLKMKNMGIWKRYRDSKMWKPGHGCITYSKI